MAAIAFCNMLQCAILRHYCARHRVFFSVTEPYPDHSPEPCTLVQLQVRDTVAIHVPCSSKKMGIEDSFAKIAGLCANEVVPTGIPCCGMAGDRGLRYTELTGASLQHLNLPSSCSDGYSTSRTCEMSLSNHSGINFRGLVYLVDEATKPKKQAAAAAAAQ
jgi:D-lactate dehydrogenase